MTAREYFTEWLSNKLPELELNTYEAYQVYIFRHIVPYFESLGKPLEKLTPLDIRRYITDKRTSGRMDGKPGGLSVVSVRKHLAIIKQALREGELYGLIPRSPAECVTIGRRSLQASGGKLITLEQANAILEALRGHELHDLVFVTLHYGLRRSEVLGLKWSAVDFIHDELRIEHTVVKGSTIQAKDRTKTPSSRRVFPLLPDVKLLLQNRRARAQSKSPYIFTWEDGRLYRPDYVTRGFQRALKANGLDKLRFHDLRHATATILFDQGWSIADVQHWLGHSDIETTMNIYVAYSASRKLTIGGALAGLFRY